MKKSNVLITVASAFAFCWILLIGWFAASAINCHIHGKDSVFAHTRSQFLESRKKTFPAPARELIISGTGNETLTIVAGSELSVLAHPRVWDCSYSDLKNGKGVIRFRKLTDYDEPVTLRIPGIPLVTMNHVRSAEVIHFTGYAPHFQCTRVGHFDVMNCKIRSLNIDFPGKSDPQEIVLASCNQIDTLVVSVRGYGNLRLEMTGRYDNQLFLSDAIRLEAKPELLKKVTIR
jgi:hypothetical protein